MTPEERYTLIQQAMQAFNPHYQEKLQQIFADSSIQGIDWFFSYLAFGLEPEALTVDVLHQMTPYANRQTQAERLAQTAENGYLELIGQESYCLTAAGRNGVEAFFTGVEPAIAPLMPLSAEKMTRLADLLARITTATEMIDPPVTKTHFDISRRSDAGPEATAASKIDQYLTDLLRFRDDAHLAAWVDLGVDGRSWDAFTAIWRDQANNAAALAETLVNRNYSEADYVASLEDLVGRDWIEEVDGTYRVTRNGRQLREAAEENTDRIFFIGWSALNDDETVELDSLLTELRDRLQEMAADQAVARNSELWPLAAEISGSIFSLTRSVMDPLFEEMGLAERGLSFALILGGSFAPEPVSSDRIRRRFPYSAAGNWDHLLEQVAERGLFSAVGDGSYLLTDNGRSALDRFLNTFRNHLGTIEMEIDLERLAALLNRIITACLNTSEPPKTWAIRHSRNVAPAEDACALAKIDQFLDDLNAFRDDAHIAAFASHDISGHAWEFLTMLWRDQVKTAAEMVERMGFRGHDEASYAVAMDDLAAHGWVKLAADGAELTDAGKEIRDAAEIQTDRYFYFPWLALNQAETDELRELMCKTTVLLN